MSSFELTKHVLGTACQSERQVEDMLKKALLSETEPLLYFSLHLNIDEKIIYQRAAQWCGLVFNDTIPGDIPANPKIARIDTLAEVKTIRAKLLDRDVLFTAAGFVALLRIRDQLHDQPELAGKICIVPPPCYSRRSDHKKCAFAS